MTRTCQWVHLRWFIALIVTTCWIPSAMGQTVYKCIDEAGVTFFSDLRCSDAEALELRVSRPAESDVESERELLERGSERVKAWREKQKEGRQKSAQRRRTKCDADRKQLTAISSRACASENCKSNPYLVRGKDGKQQVGTEKARQAQIQRLKKRIASSC